MVPSRSGMRLAAVFPVSYRHRQASLLFGDREERIETQSSGMHMCTSFNSIQMLGKLSSSA